MSEGDLNEAALTEAIAKIHGLTEDPVMEKPVPRADKREGGRLIILGEEFAVYDLRLQLNELRRLRQDDVSLTQRRLRAAHEAEQLRADIEAFGETPCR